MFLMLFHFVSSHPFSHSGQCTDQRYIPVSLFAFLYNCIQLYIFCQVSIREIHLSRFFKNIHCLKKPQVNCFPSSRQSKKQKLFLPPDAKNWWQFYAANIYCSCFSNGVNTPRFLCNRFVL